jgi:hypothetical protein
MATHGERGDEATACTFKWWVRLTGGPSPISDFSQDFQTPKFEIQNGDLPIVYNSQNIL